MVNHMTPTDPISQAALEALGLRTPKYLAWRAEFMRASDRLSVAVTRLQQERERYGAGHESKLTLQRYAEAIAEVARLTAVDVVEPSAKAVGR